MPKEVQKHALHILAFFKKFRTLSVDDHADNVSFVVLFLSNKGFAICYKIALKGNFLGRQEKKKNLLRKLEERPIQKSN